VKIDQKRKKKAKDKERGPVAKEKRTNRRFSKADRPPPAIEGREGDSNKVKEVTPWGKR